jgi:hypothetical protein
MKVFTGKELYDSFTSMDGALASIKSVIAAGPMDGPHG